MRLKINNVVLNIENNKSDDYEFKYLLDDLNLLKQKAIETIKWKAGRDIMKTAGSNIMLSAANSKAITLLAKVLKDSDTTSLTEIEKSSFDYLVSLGEKGYSDSEMLNATLEAVDGNIALSVDAVIAIEKCSAVEEVFESAKSLGL